ncbi:ABC-F family ATP-binding cassette domain-containing protein [Hymenobacter jeollabukensis]|uniref:ABC-F family ATP-binding cassette domain-containing protein n=1 Tax=Hymenobacter jeollabukensis TaxID=2025313 RepID=A0A5R8WQ28_9BACT|nr:ABC-F family ATP-binding cassette domain-containing protein [Hymenobacter jeollabukensis]TLM92398.1 ABC-F family ATP-binding cassette domain-containing protein [Hymenobacter jeollabukensis]
MSIVANHLSYTHPDGETLFLDLHLAVPGGGKASLVGPNGAGKSTLLRLLAGQLPPTAGEVLRPEPPYYVPQHLGQYDALTVAEALGVADKLRALHAILAGDATAEQFARLDDDWSIEERVQTALAHWQLPPLDLHLPLGALSGGEKTKVFLAGAQLHGAGLMLLDEPSNHLDAASRQLLYDFLRRTPATVLVVSHDRALLNLVDLTLELLPDEVAVYGGNYDFYQAQKQVQLAALQAQLDATAKTLQQARQKARDVAEQRHKQDARGTAQGQKKGLPRIVAGHLKRQAEQSSAQLREVHHAKIDGLSQDVQQLRTQLREQQALRIDLSHSALHRGKVLVEAEGVNFAYAGQPPLWAQPLTLQLRSGQRLRIEGPNGAGKTTLVKLLTGQLVPTTGQLHRAAFTSFYLDQEYSLIDNQLTVFEQLQRYNSRQLLEHELKTVLHYHQFARESWDRPCAGLSGGEKLKLILCCLTVSNRAPDLLILDEPTNNLDLPSQQVLTDAVRSFQGTLLLISHDQPFADDIGVDETLTLG